MILGLALGYGVSSGEKRVDVAVCGLWVSVWNLGVVFQRLVVFGLWLGVSYLILRILGFDLIMFDCWAVTIFPSIYLGSICL